MPIILSHPMSSQEIRILQEFRRIASDTMSLPAIEAIKHPAGGGAAPLPALVLKGYLLADAAGQSYSLTAKGKQFISLDVKPEFEEAGAAASVEE